MPVWINPNQHHVVRDGIYLLDLKQQFLVHPDLQHRSATNILPILYHPFRIRKRMAHAASSTMGALQDRVRMREEIAFMESANRKRQEKETTDPAKEANSSLPSPLPRPEYAISSGIIGADDAEVDFYVSCKRGHLSEVIAYVEHHQPRNGVLQYGLEQASFADQPTVVPYLLESGAAVH